jgi:hypothetical protein
MKAPLSWQERGVCADHQDDHQDYAASSTAITASQAGLAALVGIIRNSA